MEGFSFPQEFKSSFEIRFTTFSQKKKEKKNKKNPLLIATKIGYFAQFGIFAVISGCKQSQNSFLICLLFSVVKLQTQK